jgi:hypothetical protein
MVRALDELRAEERAALARARLALGLDEAPRSPCPRCGDHGFISRGRGMDREWMFCPTITEEDRGCMPLEEARKRVSRWRSRLRFA